MATVALGQIVNGYLTKTGEAFDKAGKQAENFERLFETAQYSAQIGVHVNRLRGREEEAFTCDRVSNAFGMGRSTLGFARVVFPLEKLFTGKLFFQRYSASDIEKARREGYYQPFMKEAAFKKVAVDKNGNPKEIQSENEVRFDFVSEDAEGIYLTRDWMDIAMDICVLAARVLSPLTWLNKLKAIDLGKHAKGIGTAISCLWATVLTFNFIQSIRDLINETDPAAIRKKFADTLRAGLTFLTIPGDCFDIGVGMNAHPVFGIVTGAICLLDCVAYLVHELMTYC